MDILGGTASEKVWGPTYKKAPAEVIKETVKLSPKAAGAAGWEQETKFSSMESRNSKYYRLGTIKHEDEARQEASRLTCQLSDFYWVKAVDGGETRQEIESFYQSSCQGIMDVGVWVPPVFIKFHKFAL